MENGFVKSVNAAAVIYAEKNNIRQPQQESTRINKNL